MWITAPANALPCGRGLVKCGIELPMSREGGYMGASIPGGLPYQPWAAELVKKNMATSSKDDPHGQCLPDTFLRAYGLPHIVKFVQTPQSMVSFYAGADYRAQITQRDGSDAGTIIGVAGVQGALSSRVSLFLEGGYGAGLQKNDDDVRVTDRRPDRCATEILM